MVGARNDLPKMGCVSHVHFVGIGGAGMCGIAEVLFNEGYKVTGSDLQESSTTRRLSELGICVYNAHQRENVINADVVVQSTAVTDQNPEIIAAREFKIPVIPRAEMLAELMRFRHGIAIAGTHGKTTTTSLVSSVLAGAGLDPSFVIGGKLNSAGSNANLGTSPYIVVEADESDASFLHLKPMMAVVTNIDADHMGTYNEDFDKLLQTFIDFLHRLPFYGVATLCLDDDKVRSILPHIKRRVVTYGFDKEAEVRALDWQQNGLESSFKVVRKNYPDLHIKFNLPGRHNVLNALAAIAIATELEVEDHAIKQSLASFQGVGRRFQLYGNIDFGQAKALLVDDYGHHPQEIVSTIDTIRRVWPSKRLVHVFQPHRYSRTEALYDEFAKALATSDCLCLLDIYPAGETPIKGVSSEDLAHKIQALNQDVSVKVTSCDNLSSQLAQLIQDGDIILTQGAGNIGQMAKKIAKSNMEQTDVRS